MKTWNRTLLLSALLVSGQPFSPTSAPSAPTTFTLDPNQSSLTISATFSTFLGPLQLQQQAAGSLTTTYEGSIAADVTGTSIEFTGGSLIAARTNGNWQPGIGGTPGASAPANYGGQTTGMISTKSALRQVLLEVVSDPLTVANGNFPAQLLVFGFPAGASSVLDFAYAGGYGSYPLTGYSTNGVASSASLTKVGDELVLVIPVRYTGYVWLLQPNDLTYTLTGQLVARAAVPPAPLELSMSLASGDLVFTLNTSPGVHYTILSWTNLLDAPELFDAFTASESTTVRTNGHPVLPMQFFEARKD